MLSYSSRNPLITKTPEQPIVAWRRITVTGVNLDDGRTA